MKFKYGDYVIYTVEGIGFEKPGRVVEDMGDKCRVCYYPGCTSALTPNERLQPASKERITELEDLNLNFGYHRFDSNGCPDFERCPLPFGDCKPRKTKKELEHGRTNHDRNREV